MNWKHIGCVVLALLAGYILGMYYPGPGQSLAAKVGM